MLFTESSEANIGNFHSMFLVFTVDGAFFDKLLSLHREIENASSSSKCILKTTNPKIVPWNQQPIQGRLAWANQA